MNFSPSLSIFLNENKVSTFACWMSHTSNLQCIRFDRKIEKKLSGFILHLLCLSQRTIRLVASANSPTVVEFLVELIGRRSFHRRIIVLQFFWTFKGMFQSNTLLKYFYNVLQWKIFSN